VPEGFIILPTAFQDKQLIPEAWKNSAPKSKLSVKQLPIRYSQSAPQHGVKIPSRLLSRLRMALVRSSETRLLHAAIVARELGTPAVVGCGDATMRLQNGD